MQNKFLNQIIASVESILQQKRAERNNVAEKRVKNSFSADC